MRRHGFFLKLAGAIGIVTAPASVTPVAAASDGPSGDLKEARSSYRKAVSSARKRLLQAINVRIRAAGAEGNLGRANRLIDAREALKETGQAPRAGAVAAASRRYRKTVARQNKKLIKAYRRAIQKAARSGAIDRADHLQATLDRLIRSTRSQRKESDALAAFSKHRGTVYDVAFLPGDSVASVGADRTIRIWKAKTATPVKTLRGHGAAVRDIAVSPHGRFLATVAHDRSARLWDVEDGKPLRRWRFPRKLAEVVFSSEGHYLAVGGFHGITRVIDLRTGKKVSTWAGKSGGWYVAAAPNDRLLATAGGGRKLGTAVRLWSVAKARRVGRLTGHPDVPAGLAFLSDPLRLISGDISGNVRIWNVKAGEVAG